MSSEILHIYILNKRARRGSRSKDFVGYTIMSFIMAHVLMSSVMATNAGTAPVIRAQSRPLADVNSPGAF